MVKSITVSYTHLDVYKRQDYVIEHLADDDAVLVIDETGFLKQGKASCGVAPVSYTHLDVYKRQELF